MVGQSFGRSWFLKQALRWIDGSSACAGDVSGSVHCLSKTASRQMACDGITQYTSRDPVRFDGIDRVKLAGAEQQVYVRIPDSQPITRAYAAHEDDLARRNFVYRRGS